MRRQQRHMVKQLEQAAAKSQKQQFDCWQTKHHGAGGHVGYTHTHRERERERDGETDAVETPRANSQNRQQQNHKSNGSAVGKQSITAQEVMLAACNFISIK